MDLPLAGPIDRIVRPYPWGHNLNALADILRAGFGLPRPLTLVWKNAHLSQEQLGHAYTAGVYETMLPGLDADWKPIVERRLAAAKQGEGPTYFDEIVATLKAEDVDLRLG